MLRGFTERTVNVSQKADRSGRPHHRTHVKGVIPEAIVLNATKRFRFGPCAFYSNSTPRQPAIGTAVRTVSSLLSCQLYCVHSRCSRLIFP